ncbi:cobalamin biosynthesis protein CbiN [Geobacter sulfurreducens]|nr:cobalamin biosynthesis protein CbiN [Geobacter sulfurreducens]
MKNILMLIAVVALMAFPLWLVQKPAPGPDGKEVEIFKGADDQAQEIIKGIKPDYKPWFKPIMEPPSGEVQTCLFAVQSALGAIFIGYWLGAARTRAKYENAAKKAT